MTSTPPPGPTLGPGTAWIDGDSVAGCCRVENPDPERLEVVAVEASMVLYEVSGRRFSGLCETTVRPASQPCRCYATSRAAGLGAWYWTSTPYGWAWADGECGDTFGCQPMSVWRLNGYPVRQVTQVKIDGAVVDPSGYRLDGWRNLVRLDDPGPPVVRRAWPGCQNMSLNDDQPGTFSVSYQYGIDPPPIGLDAACQLACQLYLACSNQKCELPSGATKVTRQGVQVDRGLLANWFDPTKPTGLVAVDAFLAAYWSRARGRRPAVFSQDVQKFGRRVGT